MFIINQLQDQMELFTTHMSAYVDDLLCMSHESSLDIDQINHYFKMKGNSCGVPKVYLGGQINAITLSNNVHAWSFTSSKYVQDALENIQSHICTDYNMKLPTRVSTPCTSGYRPELDISRELTDSRAVYLMSLIRILRWAVRLGRIDIETEVSKLSSFLAALREDHLSQALHIFAYLKKYHNSGIVFDPTYPDVNEDYFKANDDGSTFTGTKVNPCHLTCHLLWVKK